MNSFCFRKSFIVFLLFVYQVVFTAGMAGAQQREISPEDIQAKSAILMDENGVVLFEKNSHLALPPASVTKTMTLLLVVEAIEAGKISLSDLVKASENAWRQGGSQIWLEQGELLTVRELLISLAVVSANDAAVALMEHIYGTESAAVEAMNARVQELGLSDTHFTNVNGLPAENHVMSVYDTAMIVKEAVRHPLYMEVCGIKEYWLRDGKNWLVNTNKLLWWYAGADGLKTGWTEEAKYCFAGTAKRDGLRLISVVFAAPEPRLHLKESMKLFDWGFQAFRSQPIVQKNEIVTTVRVGNGVKAEMNLIATEDLVVLTRQGDTQPLEREIVVDDCPTAPIHAAVPYGTLTVTKEGKVYGQVALVAESDIEQAGFWQILQLMAVKFLGV